MVYIYIYIYIYTYTKSQTKEWKLHHNTSSSGLCSKRITHNSPTQLNRLQTHTPITHTPITTHEQTCTYQNI